MRQGPGREQADAAARDNSEVRAEPFTVRPRVAATAPHEKENKVRSRPKDHPNDMRHPVFLAARGWMTRGLTLISLHLFQKTSSTQVHVADWLSPEGRRARIKRATGFKRKRIHCGLWTRYRVMGRFVPMRLLLEISFSLHIRKLRQWETLRCRLSFLMASEKFYS